MAKKKAAAGGDRQDPKKNKSLAIRTVLQAMPNSKAAEVAAEVKKQFGHDVSANRIYMIKAKKTMRKSARAGRKAGRPAGAAAPSSAASWVDSIRCAKQLLSAAGSVDNAVAVLKAVGS